MGNQCPGCKEEMEMCYIYQNKKDVIAGLDWCARENDKDIHCIMFAFDEITGEQIVW